MTPGAMVDGGRLSVPSSCSALVAVLAIVCGLVVWHGSGILFVIIPNAIAASVGRVVGIAKRKAAAASLFALFADWSAAFVVLIGWQVHSGGFGYVTDFQFWLFWPAMIVALAWLSFVVPLIVFAKPTGVFYRPLFAAGSIGLVWLCLHMSSWSVRGWPGTVCLISFPAFVGSTSRSAVPVCSRGAVIRRIFSGLVRQSS